MVGYYHPSVPAVLAGKVVPRLQGGSKQSEGAKREDMGRHVAMLKWKIVTKVITTKKTQVKKIQRHLLS